MNQLLRPELLFLLGSAILSYLLAKSIRATCLAFGAAAIFFIESDLYRVLFVDSWLLLALLFLPKDSVVKSEGIGKFLILQLAGLSCWLFIHGYQKLWSAEIYHSLLLLCVGFKLGVPPWQRAWVDFSQSQAIEGRVLVMMFYRFLLFSLALFHAPKINMPLLEYGLLILGCLCLFVICLGIIQTQTARSFACYVSFLNGLILAVAVVDASAANLLVGLSTLLIGGVFWRIGSTATIGDLLTKPWKLEALLGASSLIWLSGLCLFFLADLFLDKFPIFVLLATLGALLVSYKLIKIGLLGFYFPSHLFNNSK